MDFHSENDRDQLNCEPQEEVEQMEAVDQMEEVEEELCESAFIVEGIDMEAHKAVLAACSAYFRAIYREQKKRALKKNSRTTGGAGNINAAVAQSTADEQSFSQKDIVVIRSDYQNE